MAKAAGRKSGRLSPRARRAIIGAVVLLTVLLVGGRIAVSLYTETLWFAELGHARVFWSRLGATLATRATAALLAAALVFGNLWVVTRGIGPVHVRRRYGNLEIAEQVPRRLVHFGIVVVALLAGWWLAEIVFDPAVSLHAWLWTQRPDWGIADPVFGNDVSFYVFTLPLLQRAIDLLLLVIVWTAMLVAVGYVLLGAIRWESNRLTILPAPLAHLGALAASLVVLFGVGWFLGRYALLFDGTGIGGALGYTDAHARMPGRWAILLLSLFAGWSVLLGARRGTWVPAAIGVGAFLVGVLVFGQALPAALQKLRVEPNELAMEAPYIGWNIGFTRAAYGLDRMRREPYAYSAAAPTAAPSPAVLEGLPRWDPDPLQKVYNQNQTQRSYYTFPRVDFDRYGPPNDQRQVAIAVREFSTPGLPEGARTWQTLHLNPQFVRGIGAVVSPAAGTSATGEPVNWIGARGGQLVARADDAPAELRIDNPSIYFGESMGEHVDYIVVNPRDSMFAGQPGIDFPAGIPLDSPLRLLAFAWRFGEQNLIFSGELDSSSRIVYRRALVERLRALAPFVLWDSDPLPVIHDGRIVWMLDGYTATSNYPLSRAIATENGGRVRYLRASVKATIDAVTGGVAMYVVDESDPLAQTYRRAFPSLLRPIAEMPAGLQAHLRYPVLYLNAQASILEEYHVDDPRTFYAGQEEWEVSKALGDGGELTAYRPSFVRVPLPPAVQPEFLLLLPFIARERQNMTALLVARNDAPNYGELVLLEMPPGELVQGPSQVQSAVEQDPLVAEQLSLWRRAGSDVDLGQLRVVPTGGGFLYMQPLFLSATGNPIPELRAVIVSDGASVRMETTLAEAVAGLAGQAANGAPGTVPTPGPGTPAAPQPAVTPAQVLDLLDRAERRLREGDFAGFGADLREVRRLLEELDQ
ncbi:MAG TPA: UPF0182 family protein [Longimicrobiales bacterium]